LIINASVRQVYVAVSKQLHVSSTRCNHCRTCHQTILKACQLKIIKVMLQLQRTNYLSIIQWSNNDSLIEYWNSCFTEFMYV